MYLHFIIYPIVFSFPDSGVGGEVFPIGEHNLVKAQDWMLNRV